MLNKIVIFSTLFFIISLSFIPAYSAPQIDLSALSEDEYFMALALAEIGRMLPEQGWPVGAVVIRDNEIIGRSANCLFATNDPTQHAEYLAIDSAIQSIKKEHPGEQYTDFFKNATVYVTLEPCPMCAGKITMLRFERVVFCDTDEEWGRSPENVIVEQSSLHICKEFREKPGWNHEELWNIGKLYAASSDQIPNVLSNLVRKVYYEIFF